MTVSVTNPTQVEHAVAYQFDNAGRLGSVSGGAFQAPSQFNYSYLVNSGNLISSVTGPVHTVTNIYEANRNVLSHKQNKVGTTEISGYQYLVNSLNQRTSVSQTGSAFSAPQGIEWEKARRLVGLLDGGAAVARRVSSREADANQYDILGQVIKAQGSIMLNDRAYQYDAIGNRKKSADSLTLPETDNYVSNSVNQYTNINQGASVSPVYDNDGNATQYPLPADLASNSTLVWDGENRLVSATTNGITTTYQYDSQSRRIAKTTGGNTTIILYDGWNPIAEYNTSFKRQKKYTWGQDLSGSIQGAGGVGGLLKTTSYSLRSAGEAFYPTFDGNGNVSEYLDETGTIVAHYQYDPFGRIAVINGAKAEDFAHRFSTKPLDQESGLYYYGHRYYDPETGRWPSRDPLADEAFFREYSKDKKSSEINNLKSVSFKNLYCFVSNDALNGFDFFGLFEVIPGAPGIDKWWKKVNLGGGAAFGAIEVAIQLYICCKGKAGIEGYVRTPGTMLMTLNPLGLSAIISICDGPGTIYLYAKKYGDGFTDCTLEYRLVCENGPLIN